MRNTATLHGVKIEDWSYDLDADTIVREAIRFRALSIDVADEP